MLSMGVFKLCGVSFALLKSLFRKFENHSFMGNGNDQQSSQWQHVFTDSFILSHTKKQMMNS